MTLAPVTRFRFEDVLDTSIGASSEKYSDYARLLPYAFMEHRGGLGEGLALYRRDIYARRSIFRR